MSNFLELQAAVLEATSRTDKTTTIQQQINSAIRLVSHSGLYWRDFQEVTLSNLDGINAAVNIQAITIPAQFRVPLYIRYPEAISKCQIEIVPIETLIHPDYMEKTNVAYASGTTLHIKNKTLTDTLALGYYAYPVDLVDDLDTNWITDYLPDLLIEMAASFVKTITGDQTTAKSISSMSTTKLSLYLRDLVNKSIAGV